MGASWEEVDGLGGLQRIAHLAGGGVQAHHHVGDILAQGLRPGQRLKLAP